MYSLDQNFVNMEIFSEVSLMSAELRESIKQMDRYYRFDVGDEIRQMLRDIKYTIADISRYKNGPDKYQQICVLVNLLDHLTIALSDCIEDGALKLSGKYSISSPLSRLERILGQAGLWKSYVYDKYVATRQEVLPTLTPKKIGGGQMS